jgi:predicted metal-dependent enzyme (double-stranded beta helix superfamily)
MFIDNRDGLVAALERLAATPELKLTHLNAFARAVLLSDELLASLQSSDPANPYGRNVIHACDVLECMVATWTPGVPCLPHDHGGAYGAVRVLQGEALHRIWSVKSGRLDTVHHHTASPGAVLTCGPSMVHSMGDHADQQPLVTLHLYTSAIDHMVVYDPATTTTHVVDGACGAWIPTPESGLLRSSRPGFFSRADLLAA